LILSPKKHRFNASTGIFTGREIWVWEDRDIIGWRGRENVSAVSQVESQFFICLR
jgi:hypothetical protein